MIILEPLTIAAAPTAGGTGAAFLLSPDPKEIWLAPGTGAQNIDVDLGAAMDVDCFYLGFHNATADATIAVQKGTGLGSGLTMIVAATALRAGDSLGPRHHFFHRMAAPQNSRYFRLVLTQGAGGAALQAGALLLGVGLKAPYEFGSGRTPIDTGIKEPLIGGGFGIGEGVVKAQVRWTFVDLTPAQRRSFWALTKRRGEMKPIVVVEETGEDAGLGEEIHYGLFDKFQAYEREAPGETRWALSMTEWV